MAGIVGENVIDQETLHDGTLNPFMEEKIDALNQLSTNFEFLPDREQAFDDMLRLSSDKDKLVAETAVKTLELVYPHVSDRKRLWTKLAGLTANQAPGVQKAAVHALASSYTLMPGEQRVWNDFLKLAGSGTDSVKEYAFSCLKSVFPLVPDKTQAWKDLFELRESADMNTRVEATRTLGTVFSHVEDQDKAWKELFKLALEERGALQKEAFEALASAFIHSRNKETEWQDLLGLIDSEKGTLRRHAADTMFLVFPHLPDRNRAWSTLLRLSGAADSRVRNRAADSITSLFPHLEDKDGAWIDLTELAGSKVSYIRGRAADTLVQAFPHVSDKKKAWEDLLRLTAESHSYVIRRAMHALASAYPYLAFDEEASEEFSKITRNPAFARRSVAYSLASVFKEGNAKGPGNPEKQLSVELLKLAIDEDSYVRMDAADSLASAFPHLPEKKKICNRLLNLSAHPNPIIRKGASVSLRSLFSLQGDQNTGMNEGPDKDIEVGSEKNIEVSSEKDIKASLGQEIITDVWEEVLRMGVDNESSVRKDAADLLALVFPKVENKKSIFYNLSDLCSGPDNYLRKSASDLLALAFPFAEDKQDAWDQLVQLTSHWDKDVRKGAAKAFAPSFSQVPDKKKAWADLLSLTNHRDSSVQRAAVRAFESAYTAHPDPHQALESLKKLTGSERAYVRKYAFRSLGIASLHAAAKAKSEAECMYGLKEAVLYFRNSAKTASNHPLPGFYLNFYEAFLNLLSAGSSGKFSVSSDPSEIGREESEKYFSAMVCEMGDVDEIDTLSRTFSKFAKILQEAAEPGSIDLASKKKLLESSLRIFEDSCALFERVEEEVVLSKKFEQKGHPALKQKVSEQRLKDTLEEIREKARFACFLVKGTSSEEIASAVSREVRDWTFESPADKKVLMQKIESLETIIRINIPESPENSHIFDRLEDIRKERHLLSRCRIVARLVGQVPMAMIPAERAIGF
ncbi:HEAT repeat domain-containing protein [Methanosarcina sp. Mfa9]|uniref:HEAT repeat domain-containing protein n=1 Tax=Methanosarcina sp. Mfa9 TaxID=3439063 RepID=UPI003F871713